MCLTVGNTLICRAVFDGAGIARQALVLVEGVGQGDIEVVKDRQRTVRIA